MNILLFSQSEIRSDGTVHLSDFRFDHIREVLKSSPDESIRIGVREGLMGTASILSITEAEAIIVPTLTTPPPKPLPVKLIVAMCRPKSFRKLLHTAVVMGVKEIHVIKSWKVDKSYWTTPFLTPAGLDEIILDGLMQTRDTVSPTVMIHKGFKPFVEDRLASIAEGSELRIFHPLENAQPFVVEQNKHYTIVIGPEGGFIPYEVDLMEQAGAIPTTLGPRIQRVEQAIGSVLGFVSMGLL